MSTPTTEDCIEFIKDRCRKRITELRHILAGEVEGITEAKHVRSHHLSHAKTALLSLEREMIRLEALEEAKETK